MRLDEYRRRKIQVESDILEPSAPVFLSFNEPDLKRPCDVSVIATSDVAVMNNSPEEGSEAICEGRRVVFAITAFRPNYGVSLTVGPYDVVSGPQVRPTPVRIHAIPIRAFTTPGKGPKLVYRLESTYPELAGGIFETAYPYAKFVFIATTSCSLRTFVGPAQP